MALNPFLAGQRAARGQSPVPQGQQTNIADVVRLRAFLNEQQARQQERAQAAEQQAAEQAARKSYVESLPPNLRDMAVTKEGFNEAIKIQANQMAAAQKPVEYETFGNKDVGFYRFNPRTGERELIVDAAPDDPNPGLTAAMRIRAQKIQDAMRLNGMSEKQATALVDGQIKSLTDPVSGEFLSYNQASGAALPIEAQGSGISTPMLPETGNGGLNIDELAQGTGALSAAKSALGNTIGQLAPSLVDEKNVNARTGLRQLNDKMIAAFSISGRPPVVEQERILQMLPAPGIFQSPRDAELTLNSLKSALTRQYNTDAAMLDRGGLPPSQQKSLIESMRLQKNIIDQLGSPSKPQKQVTPPNPTPPSGANQKADLTYNPATGMLE